MTGKGLAAIGLALGTAACTLISGVEGYELRQGGPRVDASSEGAAEPPEDAAPVLDAPVEAAPVGCVTAAECQEERCKADLPDSRIPDQVGMTLGVTATCTAGTPRVINPGPAHYYGADVRCTLVPQPTPTAVSTFTSDMNAAGWYGYSTKQEGAAIVVVGQSTTRMCSTY